MHDRPLHAEQICVQIALAYAVANLAAQPNVQLIFRDRIAFVKVAGIPFSLLGVLVIVACADLDTLLRLQFNWGDLIILFNMALLAVYAAYLRLRPQIHWLSFLFLLGVISTVATLPRQARRRFNSRSQGQPVRTGGGPSRNGATKAFESSAQKYSVVSSGRKRIRKLEPAAAIAG